MKNFKNCHSCGHQMPEGFHFGYTSVAHDLKTELEGEDIRCPINLAMCRNCGLVQLTDSPPPETFYSNYRVLSSWKKEPHMADSLDRLLLHLRGGKASKILEIGCNDGGFLDLLKARGYDKVWGIEPAHDAFLVSQNKGHSVKNVYFNQTAAAQILTEIGQVDAIIVRQVLEHIIDLNGFLSAMRSIAKPGCAFLIDVPDSAASMQWLDYSALWEEHVNYFTPDSLYSTLNRHGLSVCDKRCYAFSGVALSVTGVLSGVSNDYSDIVDDEYLFKNYIDSFGKIKEDLHVWILDALKTHKLFLYGAGNRSNTFIQLMQIKDFLSACFDDQMSKIGCFLPGTQLEIKSSHILVNHAPSVCLLGVNSENETHILSKHASYLEIGGVFLSIHPPSNMLIPPLRSA
jgi:SAM-dependent methyltransferase